MDNKLEIFDQTCFVDLLNFLFKRKKQGLRNWAQELNLTSHSQLHNFLKGNRLPGITLIQKIIDTMALNTTEAEFLLFHYQLEIAQKTNEHPRIKTLKMKIEGIRDKKALEVQYMEADKLLFCVYTPIFIECIRLHDFELSIEWFRQRLGLTIPDLQIEKIIDKIFEIGILSYDDQGKLQNKFGFLTTHSDIPKEELKNYHAYFGKMALEKFRPVAVELREFQGMCFGIQKERLPDLKLYLRHVIAHISENFEAHGRNADELYQINLQLFPLSLPLNAQRKIS